jgi:type II secretory pathway pseudopilin PulG
VKRQRGFALLLVFVLAAAIAITLYTELPRVAFEAQRNKEEMLIERGEQYTRAIQLYVRKVKKYPATIEELENTNQIRFLRKRYNDPMTGKSEWRLVHVGPGGVFTDSLTHKPPAAKEEEKAVNTFVTEAAPLGSTAQQAQTGPGFPLVRPSDRVLRPGGLPGQPTDPLNPQLNAQQQAGYPQSGVGNFQNFQNPNQQPGAVPLPPGMPGLPPGVMAPSGAYPPGFNPQQPGFNPQAGFNPQQPGFNPQQQQFQTGFGLPPQPVVYPGQPANSQTGGVSPYPYSTQPGAQGGAAPIGQPGTTPNPAGPPGQNQALSLINQILTTPRGPPAGAAASQPLGTQIGGGIAGIASTVEREGIKVYNDKEKYNEWEFLYDLTQDKPRQAGGGVVGLPGQNLPGQNQPGQNQGAGAGQQPPQQPPQPPR